MILGSLSIVKKCPHFQYQRNLARASCHQCICLLSFWGILGTHLATQWFCSHFGVKISFFSLFWGLQIPSSSATTHFPRAAALHCCCCCCVTLSAVSAWSGLASTLGIKQKSVLSQVTSEDGSPPHPHAMHLNTHAAVSLPISSPPQKLIVFQSQKNSWYPWYCEDGWWLYFYDVSLWVVETAFGVCELEISFLYMAREYVKSRSVDGQMYSRCQIWVRVDVSLAIFWLQPFIVHHKAVDAAFIRLWSNLSSSYSVLLGQQEEL